MSEQSNRSTSNRRASRAAAEQFIQQLQNQTYPASRKVYIEGTLPGVRVGMREIELQPSLIGGSKQQPLWQANAPVRVYDTSGPYTCPDARIDINKGLAALRQHWIAARGDTDIITDFGSAYSKEQALDESLQALRFATQNIRRKAKAGQAVTQLAYARRGIITPEMEYVAIRENLSLANHSLAMESGQATARLQHP